MRTCAETLVRMLLEYCSVSTGNALPHTLQHIRGVSLETVSYPVRQPVIALHRMQHPRRCGISCCPDRSRSGLLFFRSATRGLVAKVLHSRRRGHRSVRSAEGAPRRDKKNICSCSVLYQQSAESWIFDILLGNVSFGTLLFNSGVASCCCQCLDVFLFVSPSEGRRFEVSRGYVFSD